MIIFKALLFLFARLFSIAFSGAIVALAAAMLLYQYKGAELPSLEEVAEVRYSVPMQIYSSDNQLLAEFGTKLSEPLNYDQIPAQMVQAFLAAEDDRFFEHPGVDWQGLARAVRELAITGQKTQGGSTITMQLTRNLLLSNEKSFERKIKEILLSLRIERQLSKQQILTIYLNKIFLGHRAYGVGAAAKVYYGKDVADLTLPEIAMIAALPKAPSQVNPITSPAKALGRRNYVLGRLNELELIDDDQYAAAALAPVTAERHFGGNAADLEAGYAAEMARLEALKQFGPRAYEMGLRVYTSINSQYQISAQQALRNGLHAYDERHGYRGALANIRFGSSQSEAERAQLIREQLEATPKVAGLSAAVITTVGSKTAEATLADGKTTTLQWPALKWAKAAKPNNKVGPAPTRAAAVVKVGDVVYLRRTPKPLKKPSTQAASAASSEPTPWRLAQLPLVQGAFVSIDPKNGSVMSIVGGFDFGQSKFNRATQGVRQPGSAFKPFLYSAALEKGYTTASIINDAPVVFESRRLERTWRPRNASGKSYGPTRLREALVNSRNLVSIRLLRDIGVPYTIDYATKFGFDPKRLSRNLSLSLGNASITPLQLASAYTVFANGGYRIEPYIVERVEDYQGETLYTVGEIRLCDQCPSSEQLADGSSPEKATTPRYAPRIIPESNAYLVTSMMRDVVKRGTARRARALGRDDLAGKTGTTNDQKDAWFSGFNDKLAAVAWVGFDDNKELGRGEFGGRAALPIWMEYVATALDGKSEKPLELPAGMVNVRIDPSNGLLASARARNAVFEAFREGNLPKRASSVAGTAPSSGGFDDLLF